LGVAFAAIEVRGAAFFRLMKRVCFDGADDSKRILSAEGTMRSKATHSAINVLTANATLENESHKA
jgi:hypothetical protein